jgi:hypothetical protein
MVLAQNGSGITGVYRPYCDAPVFQIEGKLQEMLLQAELRKENSQESSDLTLEATEGLLPASTVIPEMMSGRSGTG